MAKTAAVLGVYLTNANAGLTRVGALTRDAQGATAFLIDEANLRDPQRPILSLQWLVRGDDEATRKRLERRGDKISLHGSLPPWFQGLLPEGALRDLVLTEMGPGDHDSFDLITRLGADLPGAVLVIPDSGEAPASAGPLNWEQLAGFKVPVPKGVVKFSLAGVQLKVVVAKNAERFTAPARSGEGNFILKLASDRYPQLPELEFSAMSLARSLGLRVAPCELVPVGQVENVPEAFLVGAHTLAVRRFDRTEGQGRIHIEDAGQVLGVWGERKYTQGNTETVINMIARFSSDWRADVLEAVRRVAVDVLIGNGDNHLKNWSFIFPGPGEVRLSPAYDIVPTVLYIPNDTLALRFAGIQRFERVRLHQFRRLASLLKVEPEWIEKEVRRLVERALQTWPELMAQLPLTDDQRQRMTTRWDTLDLVEEVRSGVSLGPGPERG
ncbi:MAG: type II toxin-antitoxin system HipA family toxin [Pseudomonadota bacterium]|jgi:serine/threonine-protein kinase HipA